MDTLVEALLESPLLPRYVILRGDDYEPVGTLQGNDELASAVLSGFQVPVRTLFDQAANVAILTALLRGKDEG